MRDGEFIQNASFPSLLFVDTYWAKKIEDYPKTCQKDKNKRGQTVDKQTAMKDNIVSKEKNRENIHCVNLEANKSKDKDKHTSNDSKVQPFFNVNEAQNARENNKTKTIKNNDD